MAAWFIHFPLIYYFHADTEDASLARSLTRLAELAERASSSERPEHLRLGGAVLNIALSDIAATLADRFVREAKNKKATAVFDAIRRDHLEPDRSREAK